MRASPLLGILISSALLTACAQGSDLEVGTGVGGHSGAGASGAGGAGGAGGSASSSSGSGADGTGGSGGTGGAGTGGTVTTSCDFDAPGPCSVAEHLPSIDGDQNHDMSTATGATSKWFDIEVMEAVSSIFSYPQLSYTATLVPPPGTSYGLFVYTGDGSGPTCSAPPVQGSGNPPRVTDTWGDTVAVDDSRWLTVEVRYLSGDACGPSDLWSLTIEGHTHP